MAPRETIQHMAIIHLLLHFRWTWIGLIVGDDDDGERFVQHLTPLLVKNGICLAFMQRMHAEKNGKIDEINDGYFDNIKSELLSTEANVIVVNGNVQSLYAFHYVLDRLEFSFHINIGKVWIITAKWDFTFALNMKAFCVQTFHGALSFSVHTKPVPAFQEFLHTLKPDEILRHFLCLFWFYAFQCTPPSLTYIYFGFERCSGEERMENLPSNKLEMNMNDESYSIYNAAYAVANAVQSLYSSQRRMLAGWQQKHQKIQPWQVFVTLKLVTWATQSKLPSLAETSQLCWPRILQASHKACL